MGDEPMSTAQFMLEYSGVAAKDRRIAELEAALRYALGMLNAGDGAAYDVRPILEAALPDNRGRCTNCGVSELAYVHQPETIGRCRLVDRPDTEGEQHG